jgi:hypothetical protein
LRQCERDIEVDVCQSQATCKKCCQEFVGVGKDKFRCQRGAWLNVWKSEDMCCLVCWPCLAKNILEFAELLLNALIILSHNKKDYKLDAKYIKKSIFKGKVDGKMIKMLKFTPFYLIMRQFIKCNLWEPYLQKTSSAFVNSITGKIRDWKSYLFRNSRTGGGITDVYDYMIVIYKIIECLIVDCEDESEEFFDAQENIPFFDGLSNVEADKLIRMSEDPISVEKEEEAWYDALEVFPQSGGKRSMQIKEYQLCGRGSNVYWI